jgi:hypothetical protein
MSSYVIGYFRRFYSLRPCVELGYMMDTKPNGPHDQRSEYLKKSLFKCCRIQPRCPNLAPITSVVVPSTSLAVVAVCRCGYGEPWRQMVDGDCAGRSTELAMR